MRIGRATCGTGRVAATKREVDGPVQHSDNLVSRPGHHRLLLGPTKQQADAQGVGRAKHTFKVGLQVLKAGSGRSRFGTGGRPVPASHVNTVRHVNRLLDHRYEAGSGNPGTLGAM
ncbi:hypothetical protein [Micromonospora parva]|uniref:hypothetical protein n=1 Tax=Micromonospora parva TaxID=1464048 RepID=UPI0033E9A065